MKSKFLIFVLFVSFPFSCFAQGRDLLGGLLEQTGIVSKKRFDAFVDAGSKAMDASEGFTEEQEYYLGRSVAAMILGKYKPYANRDANRYVSKVGAYLSALSDRPNTFNGYHFLVLDSNQINAMATPGGFIFITKGILKLMPNEEALAAVIAHEIGHVVKGHGVNAISQANMTEAFTILGNEYASESSSYQNITQLTNAFGKSVDNIVDTLLVSGYSRSQEYECDEYALKLLAKAGYDTKGLSTMLGKLSTYKGSDATGLFSTHPDAGDRIKNVNSKIPKSKASEEAIQLRADRFTQVVKTIS
ncbi:MAG: M48 family metalloprotease [Deltaproteobacteria bacterium]|nr:M48 family metalloprotease [Deltaproteobacteria bacterium]